MKSESESFKFYSKKKSEVIEEKTPYQALMYSLKNGSAGLEELMAARDAKVIDEEEFEKLYELMIERFKLNSGKSN